MMGIVSCLLVWTMSAHAGVINDQLAKYNLRFASDKAWSVKKNTQAQSEGKKIHTLEIQNGNTVLELTILSALTAYQTEQESKTEYGSILNAYKVALTPGAVSRKLSCPPEFIPKDVRTEFAGQRARVLFGYATDRKTYGVCNPDEAKMEFAFLAANLPGNCFVKLAGFRKKGVAPDIESWKKLLAEFKLTAAKDGGSHGPKSP